jgi:hypothetical protein
MTAPTAKQVCNTLTDADGNEYSLKFMQDQYGTRYAVVFNNGEEVLRSAFPSSYSYDEACLTLSEAGFNKFNVDIYLVKKREDGTNEVVDHGTIPNINFNVDGEEVVIPRPPMREAPKPNELDEATDDEIVEALGEEELQLNRVKPIARLTDGTINDPSAPPELGPIVPRIKLKFADEVAPPTTSPDPGTPPENQQVETPPPPPKAATEGNPSPTRSARVATPLGIPSTMSNVTEELKAVEPVSTESTGEV